MTHAAPETERQSAPKKGGGRRATSDDRDSSFRPFHPEEGNRGVGRLIQAKLTVGQSGDMYEQEADRAADQVMGASALQSPVSAAPPRLSRKCAACEEEETIHMKAGDSPVAGGSEAPRAVHDVLGSSGQPLDAGSRSFFEPRFGRDFAGVRIHDDSQANASARSVGAEAYAAGSRIVFAEGRYQPGTSNGRRLLAHELAHVVQQSGNGGEVSVQKKPAANAAASQSHGKVIFAQVDRDAGTINFVTESGTLIYNLDAPTQVGAGFYKFAVAVHGHDLTLTAPGEITNFTGFHYKIAPGQPNPADLLRGQPTVDIMVLVNSSAVPESKVYPNPNQISNQSPFRSPTAGA